MTRILDYCAVRALAGREIADEMFGRKLPFGFDADQPGDELALTAIVVEASRCETCVERERCLD